ncbi:adenylate/guanylate cyclase domain-containing protein [Lewinella sp. IMCC34191]|uniref:adenylate/guanylate cyclase domain-containing protein n=1 Tax=Lewinella sp. IMCC34191 TaxID=2259172 RepID=UPI000E248D2B|nr:adenylate/guanylate cyclase domain-containing protein [Lewinella sp. IMCC34191]
MLSVTQRRRFLRILPFGGIWLACSVIFLLIEWITAGGRFPETDTAIVPDARILVFALAAMTVLGLLVGYVELYFLNRRFSRLPFLRKALYKLIVYLLFIHVVVLITFPVAAAMEQNTSVWDPAVWSKLGRYQVSFTHLSTALQLSVAIGLSIVYAQVSELIGHTTLLSYLAGTYHRPIQEERIFLFLDMRSSTTITERLGHARYFDLLRDYYADLSAAIDRYGGEIYQYVGDEVIVSWSRPDGLRNNHCLRCFFDMQRALRQRADRYEAKFGLAPEFKAGLHYGPVTAGEVGVIKKHITYTGDILNATARIQLLCNTYQVDLLVSFVLLEKLPLGEQYSLRHVGTPPLRGRSEPLRLYTVSEELPVSG